MHCFNEAEMSSKNRKRRWGIAGGIVVLGILLWNPCTHAVFAVGLALDLKRLASGASGQELPVKQTKLRRSFNGKECEALLYYSEQSTANTAVVLVAGLSELGCYHPRAIALSRFLADRGLLVITPDIREFRDFQISAEPIEQILFWYKQVPGLTEGKKVNKIGIGGISFSGTLALMAAAKPEIRDGVGFVAAIGPYCSLIRCTQGWFAAAPGPARPYYPARFYAKWIVMRAALGMIGDPTERVFLHGVLDSLLLQKNVPSVDQSLSSQATRWYALATMPETRSDPELAAEIESYLVSRIYPQLDPGQALREIRCPVFLAHGEYDDLIPATESRELHQKIAGSRLLISPFLTHTHPTEAPISFSRKFGAALDTVVFFYRFAQIVQ
jgi:pimeloyl-ACP methyl ester carboxylesterase